MVQLLFEHDRRIRAERYKHVRTVFEGVKTGFPHVEAEFAAATGDLRDLVSHAARLADISVLGSGSQFAVNGWDEVREAALFGSGRPVLLVPATGIQEGSFDRIMIAWKESTEAARAIAAADPFLMFAKEVNLITISAECGGLPPGGREISAAALFRAAKRDRRTLGETRCGNSDGKMCGAGPYIAGDGRL